MTSVVETTETTPAIEDVPPITLAPWYIRAGAFVIDVVPAAAVVATTALVTLMMPLRSTWWWVCVSVGGLVILAAAVNRLLLPTVSGWSLGRAFFGIAVVRSDGAAVGPWRLMLRDLAHVLDTASVLVGWLWPLWDLRRRTIADLLVRTEVRRVAADRRPGNIRRLTAGALLTAGLLCVGGAAMGYLVVYLRDEVVDDARAQIATRGPKMIAEMLTYDPKSLRDDFAHARSLTTDKYREHLARQQEAVEKAHPVINEYWVTNSAIQSATPDRATMLVFMQGRRGAAPDERYITATVQATFAKGPGDQWRVDDLSVLTKPQPPQDGK